MSLEAALQFGARVLATPALRQKLVASVEGKQPADAARAAAKLGAEHGFIFTPEEAARAREIGLALLKRQAIARGEAPDTELSDAELELVAGGDGNQRRAIEDQEAQRRAAQDRANADKSQKVEKAFPVSIVDNTANLAEGAWNETKDFFSDAFSGW